MTGGVGRLIKIASLGDAGLEEIVDSLPSMCPSIESFEYTFADSATVNNWSADSF